MLAGNFRGKEVIFMNKIKKFFRDEEGASAVEYGIMVALIAAIIIGAVQVIGTKVNTAFNTVGTQLP